MRIRDIAESNSTNLKAGRSGKSFLMCPTQEMCDALMHLIVYQGDTEFASTEQQRNLWQSAPSEYDRMLIARHARRTASWLTRSRTSVTPVNWRLGNFSNAELIRQLPARSALLSAAEYQGYINRVLPRPHDLERLRACTKDGDWVNGETVN